MDPQKVMMLGMIITVMVAGALFFVLNRGGAGKAASSRLDVLVGKKRSESSQDILLKQAAFEADKGKIIEFIKTRVPNFQAWFEQADANIKPSSLFGIAVVLGVVGLTGSWLATRQMLFAPILGLVMFCVPFLWLWNKRRVRLNTFAAQLSDAMELVARALRAGHSLQAGMHVVAEEMPPPISIEFGRCYEEQNLGIPLEDCMDAMCNRVPNLDLRFFVTSVAIQRQTGGDLAEILDKIGHLIRERYRILGQVKALTAEGRLSGVVLIGLPFLLFIIMLHIKYDYVKMLWEKELGIKMLVAAGVSMILGALIIKKIVDIKV
ncbi:pilus assembly protein TadB [Planctomycetaceae bacterium SCGC AG-212-D15]|nr:pilus assembly protein TadB [Planctomycetaceae bacterium SCGC AG-212-D15]